MEKEFSCAQWLIRDNQSLCYPYFFLTWKHYKDRKDINKDFSPKNTESCFHPIKPIKESRLRGELAERIYDQERRIRKINKDEFNQSNHKV